MFYAIPLEDRPRWSNPPWMTLLIILVNVLVFFGPQRSEERAQQAAAQFYAASALPGIELPRFVDWLQRTDSPDRKSTRLNSSHANISYAVFCLKKKKQLYD